MNPSNRWDRQTKILPYVCKDEKERVGGRKNKQLATTRFRRRFERALNLGPTGPTRQRYLCSKRCVRSASPKQPFAFLV